MAFGGSPRCREDALFNDAAFVSVVHDGEPGYELWAGGSLGKAPALAIPLTTSSPGTEALAAAEALIDVYVTHGDIDTPARGRMKFAVEALGPDAFRSAWDQAFAAALEPHPRRADRHRGPRRRRPGRDPGPTPRVAAGRSASARTGPPVSPPSPSTCPSATPTGRSSSCSATSQTATATAS